MRLIIDLRKAGPFIGPRGGKWADPQHTIPWKEPAVPKKDQREEFEDRINHAIAAVLHFDRKEGRASGKEKAVLLNEKGEFLGEQVSVGEGSVKIPGGGKRAVLVHSHPNAYSLSWKDVIQLGARARKGELRTLIAAARGLRGEVIYQATVTKGWSLVEWNSEIRPRLDRAESRFAKKRRESGNDPSLRGGGPVMHELWEWATTRGPLKGRMTYQRVFRKTPKIVKSLASQWLDALLKATVSA